MINVKRKSQKNHTHKTNKQTTSWCIAMIREIGLNRNSSNMFLVWSRSHSALQIDNLSACGLFGADISYIVHPKNHTTRRHGSHFQLPVGPVKREGVQEVCYLTKQYDMTLSRVINLYFFYNGPSGPCRDSCWRWKYGGRLYADWYIPNDACTHTSSGLHVPWDLGAIFLQHARQNDRHKTYPDYRDSFASFVRVDDLAFAYARASSCVDIVCNIRDKRNELGSVWTPSYPTLSEALRQTTPA